MEDNNYNQNNQMGYNPNNTPNNQNSFNPNSNVQNNQMSYNQVNIPVDNQMGYNPNVNMQMNYDSNFNSSVNQDINYSNQMYGDYQHIPGVNNGNISNTGNSPKKSMGPLIIFGVITLIAIVLVITLLLENKNNSGTESSALINSNTKTLVVFFSKNGENYGKNLDKANKTVLTEGNTKVMAEKIVSFIDAELYEIVPSVPYPDDLDELYTYTRIESNKDTYPEIKDKVTNLDSYDVVFIGYPIWHASYPQIIKTFVRDNKEMLKNKIIVPFNTHAGSGNVGTYKKLFNLIGTPENKGLNGLAINGVDVSTSDETIKSWLKGLGYIVR